MPETKPVLHQSSRGCVGGPHILGAECECIYCDNVRLREALRVVVAALDDAIAHNVNATANDSAGWTQEDYDAWNAARAKGEEVLDA